MENLFCFHCFLFLILDLFRSYGNGFVWQDLCEGDIIHPVYGHEYVLKGSELLEGCSSFRLPSPQNNQESNYSGGGCESSITIRRNQSWSSFDPREYEAYKAESAGETGGKPTDVATQTDDGRRRRRRKEVRGEGEETTRASDNPDSNSSNAELNGEEIWPPPPSSSSTEPSETVNGSGGVVSRTKAAARDSAVVANIRDQAAGNDRPSGRMKASAVLLQLISCVSGSVKPGESEPVKDQKSLEDPEYRAKLHRDARNQGSEVPT